MHLKRLLKWDIITVLTYPLKCTNILETFGLIIIKSICTVALYLRIRYPISCSHPSPKSILWSIFGYQIFWKHSFFEHYCFPQTIEFLFVAESFKLQIFIKSSYFQQNLKLVVRFSCEKLYSIKYLRIFGALG